MAEYTTMFFPTDKNYIPTDEAIAHAIEYLEDVYRGHYSPVSQTHIKTRFIHSGADFDRFVCPTCGQTVKEHDDYEWWFTSILDNIVQDNQLVEVPCCGASVPFDMLGVSDRTGFATFQIDLEGAGVEYLPTPVQQAHLDQILGCPMRHLIAVFD
jgi:hypothetical protein